jgi:ribosome biogenesis ATPase
MKKRGGGAKKGNANKMVIDRRLVPRVRTIRSEMKEEAGSRGMHIDEFDIYETLVRRHVEYARKPKTAMIRTLRNICQRLERVEIGDDGVYSGSSKSAQDQQDDDREDDDDDDDDDDDGDDDEQNVHSEPERIDDKETIVPLNLMNSQLGERYSKLSRSGSNPVIDRRGAKAKSKSSTTTQNQDSETLRAPASKRGSGDAGLRATRKRGGGAAAAAGGGGGGGRASRAKRQRVANEAGGAAKRLPVLPSARYSDLGGIEGVLQEVRELIEYPLLHPEIYAHLGTEPPRGVLLHGPPGCGKTLLANAIAGEVGVPFFKVGATEIVGGMSGESEERVRELFAEAASHAPSLIFIDEIDSITPKRETAQREMERRIVAQLVTCLDDLSLERTNGRAVIVIGATNRPDSLDTSLRRTGRFDREICLGVPDVAARERILRVLAAKLRLDGEFDFALLARHTPGYVGADLSALANEAAVIAVNRIFRQLEQQLPSLSSSDACRDDDGNSNDEDSGDDVKQKQQVEDDQLQSRQVIASNVCARRTPFSESELESLSISMADFRLALKKVQPSAKREGFATVPNVSWSDVGALASVRKTLYSLIVAPIKRPERFKAYGVSVPAGVLLYGPPGCGKTLLAKAIANEAAANFISVKGPELLNKYVGDSERAVRRVFARARSSSPCIIFFDELDALAPKRSGGDSGGGGGSQASERVVNQLLTELDGLDERRDVFVIGATNRPDIIDRAMLRPGRLDKLLYVPLPSAADRLSILRTVTRNMPLDDQVLGQLDAIANDDRCARFSGADLAALAREAATCALEEDGFDVPAAEASKPSIALRHFSIALDSIHPSVTERDERLYNQLRFKIQSTHLSSSASSSSISIASKSKR